MTFPFKKTVGATTDYVKDYDLKTYYPDINMNMPWANISPYMREAINSFVLPYVGDTLYDEIVDTLQAGDAMTPAVEKFVDYLRDVCARYMVMVAHLNKTQVLASMGAVSNVATEGTTGTSLWEYKTKLWAVSQAADRILEEMLGYLQKQVEANVTYFVTNWAETTAYTALSSGLFRQVSDFQTFHNINNSLKTFKSLVPFAKEVEERIILPLLAQDQYDRLLEAITENDATADEIKLLDKVRKVVAKYAVYEASIGLAIISEQDGFRVISSTDAIDQRAYSSEVITQAIQGIREHAERSGKTAVGDLVSFLATNKADFPLWEASTANKTGNTNAEIYYAGPGAILI